MNRTLYFKNSLLLSCILLFSIPGCIDKRSDHRNYNYYLLDFESFDGWTNDFNNNLLKGVSHHGNYSCKVKTEEEFGPTYRKKWGDMRDHGLFYFANVSVYAKSDSSLKDVLLVVEIYDKLSDKNFYYESISFREFWQIDDWYQVKNRFHLPENIKEEFEVVIYIWNKGRKEFLIDDFELEFSVS